MRYVLAALCLVSAAACHADCAFGATASLTSPQMQMSVCDTFNRAEVAFLPLQEQWKQAEDDKNAASRAMTENALKPKISDLYDARNREIFRLLRPGRVESWVAVLDTVGFAAFGLDEAHLEMTGHMMCDVNRIIFSAEKIDAASSIARDLAAAKIDSVILISGTLLSHDTEHQSSQNAIEWGKPLWGPLGGLWSGAFEAPAFRLKITKVSAVH
jgi:hypothetical protein